MEKMVIELDGNIFTLKLLPLPNEIEIANYLKIEHGNILGELVTMPVALNQIANLKAEVEALTSHQKMSVEVLRAELEKTFKQVKSGTKTTLNDLEIYVQTNEEFQTEKIKLIELQKKVSIMDSFYWSAKAKIDSLQKISDKMQPDEFNLEILEGTVNNILIKKYNGNM